MYHLHGRILSLQKQLVHTCLWPCVQNKTLLLSNHIVAPLLHTRKEGFTNWKVVTVQSHNTQQAVSLLTCPCFKGAQMCDKNKCYHWHHRKNILKPRTFSDERVYLSTCSSPAFIRNLMTVGIVYKCVIFSRSIISQYRPESVGDRFKANAQDFKQAISVLHTTIRVSGNTLKEDSSTTITQWTVHHTGVTSYPAQVC